MEKPIEDLITKFEKNTKEMETILNEQREIARELKKRPDEDWDWVSVATACQIWGISQPKMYDRISKGDIKTRKFESKIFVSLRDIKNIDDKKAK